MMMVDVERFFGSKGLPVSILSSSSGIHLPREEQVVIYLPFLSRLS